MEFRCVLFRSATTPARVFEDVRGAVLDFLKESHSYLETLYSLEQQESFTADTRGEGHAEFAAERLARGAEMLRDLWWTAWEIGRASCRERVQVGGERTEVVPSTQ